MNRPDRKALLEHIVSTATKLCGFAVEPATVLLSTGLLDSMGLIELIASIQNKFQIILEIGELRRETFDSPYLMVEYICGAD